MAKIVTLGVYETTERRFFDALVQAKVEVFCDLRLRRGMRGATYAFVNSNSLQRRLSDLGIRYMHFLDLAPTQDIRLKQQTSDKNEHILKRERQVLSPIFIKLYKEEILARFQPGAFLNRIQPSQVAALFCVEREPLACHRSLAAQYLAEKLGIVVEDLKP